MQNPMEITPCLEGVDPVCLDLVQKLHNLFGCEILPHIVAHFLREMRVSTQRVSSAHEPGNLDIRVAQLDFRNVVHDYTSDLTGLSRTGRNPASFRDSEHHSTLTRYTGNPVNQAVVHIEIEPGDIIAWHSSDSVNSLPQTRTTNHL